VILEALVAGCPVLLSDKTPWRELAREGVGWDIPLDKPDEFRAVLQRFVDMDEKEFDIMSCRAKEFGQNRAIDPKVVEQNRQLFLAAIEVHRVAKA
jgi:glycosyltransferase involved in cell wall biosynthesis